MTFLLNALSILTLIIAYSVIMTLMQNGFAVIAGLTRRPATRSLAVTTALLSSSIACVGAVVSHEYGLKALGFQFSIIPVFVWAALQLIGISQSWGGHRVNLREAGDLIMSGGDYDAPRYLFLGQFYGLILGIVAATIVHFSDW
jgi:hypothetical protein